MFYDREKFDWEAREDAETIKRFEAIKANPERLNRAKACIQDSVETGKKALGETSSPALPCRTSNPATIARIRTVV